MARRIEITQIGEYAKGNVEQLLRAAVLITDQKLKASSPVDTGRFRASWDVGENTNDAGIRPPGSYSTPGITRVNYDTEKVGNVYSVHNNLPYSERLANGYSQQAPSGWVQVIAKDVQNFVTTSAEKIRNSS
jgi:hypothetical protein